jgi:hypothetical protein
MSGAQVFLDWSKKDDLRIKGVSLPSYAVTFGAN